MHIFNAYIFMSLDTHLDIHGNTITLTKVLHIYVTSKNFLLCFSVGFVLSCCLIFFLGTLKVCSHEIYPFNIF